MDTKTQKRKSEREEGGNKRGWENEGGTTVLSKKKNYFYEREGRGKKRIKFPWSRTHLRSGEVGNGDIKKKGEGRAEKAGDVGIPVEVDYQP